MKEDADSPGKALAETIFEGIRLKMGRNAKKHNISLVYEALVDAARCLQSRGKIPRIAFKAKLPQIRPYILELNKRKKISCKFGGPRGDLLSEIVVPEIESFNRALKQITPRKKEIIKERGKAENSEPEHILKARAIIEKIQLGFEADGSTEHHNQVLRMLKRAARLAGTIGYLDRTVMPAGFGSITPYLDILVKKGEIRYVVDDKGVIETIYLSGKGEFPEIRVAPVFVKANAEQEIYQSARKPLESKQTPPAKIENKAVKSKRFLAPVEKIIGFAFIDHPNLSLNPQGIKWDGLMEEIFKHNRMHITGSRAKVYFSLYPRKMEDYSRMEQRLVESGFVFHWDYTSRDIDTILVTDLLGLANAPEIENCQKVFITLVSGDNGYVYPIMVLKKALNKKGKRLYLRVVSWRSTLARGLEEIADEVILVNAILGKIKIKNALTVNV